MLERNCRTISQQFPIIHDFGFKNLIVGGCSFTYNNHKTSSVTWPYYLRDLGGFENVVDCSMFGAGNSHICNSMMWSLESKDISPNDSLIIVMWSGNDRDDCIIPKKSISSMFETGFEYTDTVMSGLTGGLGGQGNTKISLKDFAESKNFESRAVENFLYILQLHSYLRLRKYPFVFLDYRNRKLPARNSDFDIKKYLPKKITQRLQSMITEVEDIYNYAIKHNLLSDDDYHPSPNGHLEWTKQILIPAIFKLNTR